MHSHFVSFVVRRFILSGSPSFFLIFRAVYCRHYSGGTLRLTVSNNHRYKLFSDCFAVFDRHYNGDTGRYRLPDKFLQFCIMGFLWFFWILRYTYEVYQEKC